MAVEKKLNPNQEQATGLQTGTQSPMMDQGGGQQAAPAPGTQQTSAPMAAPAAKPASSGRFTNTSAYLNANQGAGQRIANAVGGVVTKDVNKAQKEVQDTNSSVASAINAEKDRLAKASGYAEQLKNDPTQIANQANELTSFQQLYNNANIGAQQDQMLQQKSQIANQALNQAQQNVAGLTTEQGRMAALQKTLARPSYTQGQQSLDQLLFQVGGANQLNDQRKTLLNQVGTATRDQNTALDNFIKDISGNKQAELDASNMLKSTLSGQVSDFEKAQIEEAQKANTDNARLNEIYRQYILGNTANIAEEDMNTIKQNTNLGDNFRTYGATRGDGYKDYLQNMRTDLSNKDVVDANELVRIQALSKLGTLESQYTAAGDRGPTSGINTDKLKSASTQAYETLLSNLAKQSNTGLTAGVNANAGLPMQKISTIGYGGNDFLKNIVTMIEQGQSGGTGANLTNAYDQGLLSPSMTGVLDWDKVSANVRGNQGINAIGEVRGGNNAPLSRYDFVAGNPGAVRDSIGVDSRGNLVAINPNTEAAVNFSGRNAISQANQQGAGALQAYLDNLLNQQGYFDQLGQAQSTESLFGKGLGKLIGSTGDQEKGK